MNAPFYLRVLLMVSTFALYTPFFVLSQEVTKQEPSNIQSPGNQAQQKRMACDEARAVLLAEKELDEIKVIVSPEQQIAVMVRVAQVLWKIRQSDARKIFTDAFALAEQVFKEKGDETKRVNGIPVNTPDQRFVVMHAIARCDARWARQLAERIAEETRKEAERLGNNLSTSSARAYRPSLNDKVLSLAAGLVTTDKAAALALIRSTFSAPLSRSLGNALYAVAIVSQPDADQLYQAALRAYADAPINELFFLAAYPFARDRNIGPEINMSGYPKPDPTVKPNPTLQQWFIEAMLRRAEASLKLPLQPTSGAFGLPESVQFIVAFNHLETISAQFQPLYVARIVELRNFLIASLNDDSRQSLGKATQQDINADEWLNGTGDHFERYSEQAEGESSPGKREMYQAFALINAAFDINLDTLISYANKLEDKTLRDKVINFIYFRRAQKAGKSGQFFEAAQLAKKVSEPDWRAYLFYEIAANALKKEEDKVRVPDMLEEAVLAASKSPDTNDKARSLLGVVFLYAKLEPLRALEVMSEAVKTINNIESPDFSSSTVLQKIEGKWFKSYYGYQVEGFDLEKVFHSLFAQDFEAALWRAKSLSNKSLRAIAVLSLAAACLEEVESIKKAESEKKKEQFQMMKPEGSQKIKQNEKKP